MSGYSKRAQELARALGEKAANNLRHSGRTVTQDAATGRYTVEPSTPRGLNAKAARELRAESAYGFSDEVRDRIWNLLDDGYSGFIGLSVGNQRKGFRLLAEQLSSRETPATPEEAASLLPEIYRELGLRVR